MRRALALLLLTGLAACTDLGPGLGETPAGDGPQVVFDFDHRPFPDIPFPNDLATRADPTSPTGRRVNASLLGSTRMEEQFRRRFDRLSGFSPFAAISVSFTAPLDVANLLERHRPETGSDDDAVLLIDLADGSLVPLDVGDGAYPLVLERPSRYYPNDPRAGESNLVFETVAEDANGNGQLDAGEDRDSDGLLDEPNTFPPRGDPVDDLLTCYERESNTLVLRPLVPLLEEHGYAVVLTRRLLGEDGQPVRSPYPYVNHLSQSRQLEPLRQWLPELGLGLADIAFAWSFTTQSTSRDLAELRQGLYGQGPYAWLAEQFPAVTDLEVAYSDPAAAPVNPYAVPAADILEALEPIAGAMLGDPQVVEALVESFSYVDLLVLGRARTPYLIAGLDGSFALDAASGSIELITDDLPWFLAIPRERPAQGISKPFPLAIYLHGTGGDRMQALGFAGQLAKFGVATVGVDLPLHGMVLPEDWRQFFDAALEAKGFAPVGRALLDNRTIDINNDGEPDPAGNFWTYDAFRSRDCVRQAALDVMRLVQVFSAFDGRNRWSHDADGDGRPELEGLAGDFDGDGRVDVVGPEGRFYLFGISLGGIVTSVAAALEPRIAAAAPISSGGGLTDIVIRSVQTGVPEMAMLPFMGPLLLSSRDAQGRLLLSQYVPDARFETNVAVAAIEELQPGWQVRLSNLENQEQEWALVDEQLRFRLAVPCDRGDRLLVEFFDGQGRLQTRLDSFDREVYWQGETFSPGQPLRALAEGFGVRRQSAEMRRFVQIAQTALDAGDPVNYAPLFFQRLPAAYPEQHEATALALVLTAGDMNVPISTGVSQARAAGLVPFGPGAEDERYGTSPQRVLVENWVLEGLERLRRFAGPPFNDDRDIILDPDNLSRDGDGFSAPRLDPPLRLGRLVGDGRQALVRFLYMRPQGAHGFGPSDPARQFNIDLFAINAIGRFFASDGRSWSDDTCLATDDCAFIPR
ncbi:MAG: hypothetical protein DRI34_08435 [Deltaproteobacteria bacterium]|nr:MAG: hypothetical protein DRI34_08435 [Deltaproteobacteria bacterium]